MQLCYDSRPSSRPTFPNKFRRIQADSEGSTGSKSICQVIHLVIYLQREAFARRPKKLKSGLNIARIKISIWYIFGVFRVTGYIWRSKLIHLTFTTSVWTERITLGLCLLALIRFNSKHRPAPAINKELWNFSFSFGFRFFLSLL